MHSCTVHMSLLFSMPYWKGSETLDFPKFSFAFFFLQMAKILNILEVNIEWERCRLRPYLLSQQRLGPDPHKHMVGLCTRWSQCALWPTVTLGHEEDREHKPPAWIPMYIFPSRRNLTSTGSQGNRGSIDYYGQAVWTTDFDAVTPESDAYLS